MSFNTVIIYKCIPHRSATTSQPFSGEVINCGHFFTMQCASGKAWVLTLCECHFDTHRPPKQRCRSRATPHGDGIPRQQWNFHGLDFQHDLQMMIWENSEASLMPWAFCPMPQAIPKQLFWSGRTHCPAGVGDTELYQDDQCFQLHLSVAVMLWRTSVQRTVCTAYRACRRRFSKETI